MIAPGATSILNSYTHLMQSVSAGSTQVLVADASSLSVADQVVVHQVQAPGQLAGNYELLTVAAITGKTVTLSPPLAQSYLSGRFDQAQAEAAQLIRVPTLQSTMIEGSITGKAWDGFSGGVIALNAAQGIVFGASGRIDADGIGFRGPAREALRNRNGRVGEGILGNSLTVCASASTVPDTGSGGCGAVNGGADGLGGAGGGANFVTPGASGNAYGGRTTGMNGAAFRSAEPDLLVLGGGGGQGDSGTNDFIVLARGGNGGGAVLVLGNVASEPTVSARGAAGEQACDYTGQGGDWGVSGGGGGGGGSVVLMSSTTPLAGTQVTVAGGVGGDVCGHAFASRSGGLGRISAQ